MCPLAGWRCEYSQGAEAPGFSPDKHLRRTVRMRLWDSPLFYWLPDVCRMDAHFLNVQLPIGVRLPGQPQARCRCG